MSGRTCCPRSRECPHRARWLNPDVDEGAWTLVVALFLASAFGGWRAVRDGRFRGTRELPGLGAGASVEVARPDRPVSVLAAADVEHELGERGTLLQFSSAFCAPCRTTRRVLTEVAGLVPGVTHVEVDAEHHLDLVRRLGITRTPTTLILDSEGREVSRASGAPKRDEVLAALARTLA